METLLEINKKGLADKINVLVVIDGCYPANDLIDILSIAKERDKRLINDYSANDVVIKKVTRSGVKREMRYFTISGVTRYLHEGKLFNYKNACEYFGVIQINLEEIEWNKFLSKCITADGHYKVSMTLKWLYGKRKTCKALGTIATKEEIIDFATDANNAKLVFLSKN